MVNQKNSVELLLTGKLVEIKGLSKDACLYTPTYGGLYCDESMDISIFIDKVPLYCEKGDEEAVKINDSMVTAIKEIKWEGTEVSCIDLITGNFGEYACMLDIDEEFDVDKLSLNIAHWLFFVDGERKWDAWEYPTLYSIVYDGKEYELTQKDNTKSLLSREQYVWGDTPLSKIVKGKIGFIDKKGNWIASTQYDYASYFENGFAEVTKARKKGYIDRNGKEVVPCIYDEVNNISDTLFSVKMNGKYGVVDIKGKEIIPLIYEYDISLDDYGLFSVIQDGFYGLIDKENNVVLPIKYDEQVCRCKEYSIFKYGRKYDLFNRKTYELIPFKKFNELLTPFVDGRAMAESISKGVAKYQIIDLKGKTVKPLDYEEVKPIKIRDCILDKYLFAKKDNKLGLIDSLGEEILPIQYDFVEKYVGPFSWAQSPIYETSYTEVYAIQGSNVICLLNLQNGKVKNFVTAGVYDGAERISENLIKVRRNKKYGCINQEGQEIIPLIYDDIWDFEEGLALVKQNEKYGYINTEGKEVIPVEYDYARSFKEGLAEVERNGKYGYINTEGKEAIPVEYDNVGNFEEGLAEVERNGKYGYINTEGKEVTPVEYDYAQNFKEGLALVKRNGKYGYINTEGKEVIPIEFDSANDFYEGLAKVKY